MDVGEYQEWVKESGLYPGSAVGDPKTLNYPVQSLASESGEVLGVLTKLQRRLGRIVVNREDMTPHEAEVLKRELGDSFWAIVASCNQLGITLEELAQCNFDKLTERIRAGNHYSHEVSD